MRSKYSFLFILLLIIVQIIIFYYSSTSIYSSGLTDPVCGCDGSLEYCYRCDEDAVDAYGEVIPCSFFDSNHWCCYYTVWDPDGCNTCTASCGACSSGTYYSTPPDNYYASGSRTCRRTNCSTYTQTCYSACPIPSCSDYNAYDPNGLTWQDTDPGSGRSAKLSIPVSNPPSGCDTVVEKLCYTTNSQPELVSIDIKPPSEIQSSIPSTEENLLSKIINKLVAQTFNDDVFGYSSELHTGRQMNNPIGIQATYSDADGSDDIQAVYVWFNPSSIYDFTTPIKISTVLDPETDSLDNWGFMIVRTDPLTVYVPDLVSIEKTWAEVSNLGGVYYIPGTTPNSMVQISNLSINSSGSDVTLQAILTFFYESTQDTQHDIIDTAFYNTWGMANDMFGFTAYESENIKDNDIWDNIGSAQTEPTTRTLDMERPSFESYSITSGGVDNIVDIRFEVTDDNMLSYVRVDACSNNIESPTPIVGDGGEYTLQSCEITGDFIDGMVIDSPNLISSSPSLLTDTSLIVDPLSIDIGNNDTGSITFYITAMDYSGNYIQQPLTYKLGDWVVVEDGLVFGKNGVSSPTKTLDVSSWSESTSNITEYGFTIDKDLDLTDQVLLGGEGSSVGFLGDLVHSSIPGNNSFKASGFSGIPITSVYSELMDIQGKKKIDSPALFEQHTSAILSGNLSDLCTGGADYCVISNDTGINISNFTCDGKALITSGGDITITPDFESTQDGACILLGNGNITIEDGGTGLESVNYDVIQALLIAGNNIVIDEDTNGDGLLVEGGLIAFGSDSSALSNIINSRMISWGYRNSYPVIAVNNSAKYGLISKDIFGSQVEIFRLEIGFKPY